ncbi:acyl-CoA dehydrogenase [Arthrobacter agilis]|uniref:acyl-CoA dehydrogenase n=1 Tax=Arthrobacter agilis TaxID=37921 RepID=UPI0023666C52|nr:acyl-CoA dehydrogenase [Arthrobacter agilis]WDF34071.1 acyl-CoA dehydrogenase [Arthrobacter agilis]
MTLTREPAEAAGAESSLQFLADRVDAARASLPAALDLAIELGDAVPLPGSGRTSVAWQLLSTLAAADLTVARVVEPHLDALAILAQAEALLGTPSEPSFRASPGAPPETSFEAPASPGGGTWGVFAAEGPGVALVATDAGNGTWTLTGTKPWCSLADHLDGAIVTAHVGDGARRAFAVELRVPGITMDPPDHWVSRGLPTVTSCPVHFDAVPATPVGGTNWYLERDGFAWGGIGVAACWYGGALGIARTLLAAARRREPDQIALLHLGRVDAALHETRIVLADAADAVDAGRAGGQDGALLAARVRSTAFRCAELVLEAAAHGLGPAPLVFDDRHAGRVADLHLYLRQHHAERDDAGVGRRVLDLESGSGGVW